MWHIQGASWHVFMEICKKLHETACFFTCLTCWTFLVGHMTPHIYISICWYISDELLDVNLQGVVDESDVLGTPNDTTGASESNPDEMSTDGKPQSLYSYLQPHFVFNLSKPFSLEHIPLQKLLSQMKYQWIHTFQMKSLWVLT